MDHKRLLSLTLTACWTLAIIPGLCVLSFADSKSEMNPEAEQHFQKANELHILADYDAAIAEYEKVISLSPNSKIAQNAQYWIGQLYFESKQFDAALSAFKRLLDEYPESKTIPATNLMIERVQQAKKNKSLHDAAEKGDVEQVKKLIAQGVDVNASIEDDMLTPLHVAALRHHVDVVKVLLKNKAKVDMGDSIGFTPLFYAIWGDNEETVKALVSAGADVNKRPADVNDYPPLVYAIWQGRKGNVEILLDAGADIETKDQKGYTTLYWAAFFSDNNKEILKLILSRKDYPDTIYMAACKGDLGRVKTLITNGTDVNAKDEFGCTSLHWAAIADSPAVADFLIAKGADVNAKGGFFNLTPLMSAHTLPVVKLLVSSGADIHAKQGRQERTKLHIASLFGDREVAEFLISKGADINIKAGNGETPLSLAAFGGHADVVELLITKGADITVSDKRGRTPLAIAKHSNHAEVVNILRQHGAKETLQGEVASGNIDEVRRLLSDGADVDAKNESLFLALKRNRMDIAELLISNGADVDAIDGQTGRALLLSVGGQKEKLKFLLSKGANIEAKDGNGLTLLQLMAAYSNQKDYLEIVELILEKGADIETRGYGDTTPLQTVVATGRKEAAELLLAHGAKIDVMSVYWGTPAHHAMRENHPDLVRWCISKGVDVPALNQAAFFGEIDKVRSLLSAGADINLKDKAEFTPLHCAVFGRNSEVVQLLLENGANLEARSCSYSAPLFWACEQGYLDIVKLLVDNGADVNGCARTRMTWGPECIIDNWSNLHIAAQRGLADVVEYLLDKGANIHARCTLGDEGLTPLHMAAGRVDVVKVLLARGANANLKSKEGRTALDFARENNHPDVVELLLKHGAKE